MPPFQGGGEMIQDVYLDHSTFAEPPSRFEAGTPGIAEAIGLGIACDYLSDIGMDKVHHYEEELGGYLHQQVWLLPILLCMLALFHMSVPLFSEYHAIDQLVLASFCHCMKPLLG